MNQSWQHDARLKPYGDKPNQFLYTNFNDYNGSPYTKNPSSGISLILSLPSGSPYTVEPKINLLGPNEPLYALAEGSYNSAPNGNMILGYGTVPTMREFSNSSVVEWEAQYGYNNLNNTASSYRVFKDVWHATPTWPLDLVVAESANATCTGSSGKVGYVSWNGATDVSGYKIYGAASGETEVCDKGFMFEKKGFETSFAIPGGLERVQLAAIVDGKETGRSAVVEI